MKTTTRWTKFGAVAALAVALVTGVSPAGAETHEVRSDLEALLVIEPAGADPVTLPSGAGSSFLGDYDDDTGTLTGRTFIMGEPVELTGTPLGDTELLPTFLTGEQITGGQITADGTVRFDDVVSIELLDIGSSGAGEPDPCVVGPIDLHHTGSHDAASGIVDVTAGPFELPPVEPGSCAAADAVAEWLDGATATWHLTFRLADEMSELDPPPPTGGALSSIKADGIVSNGCVVNVPIDFGEGGRYTLEAVAAHGRIIESVDIVRNAAGPYTARITIDPGTVTHVGARISFVLRDASGVQVADAVAPVRDPGACLAPVAVAPPAAPVIARPRTTG